MKTTIVPAQITTVEDRIAGNFTFAQILLFIVPLLTSTVTYVLVAPKMHLGPLKLSLILLQFLVFGVLAVRINGKIVVEWFSVYIHFTRRPRYYVFTKNDEAGREKTTLAKEPVVTADQKVKKPKPLVPVLGPVDESRLAQLLENPSLTVSFELAKKGGIDVSLTPIKD
ncbi:MAG: PrgI family protein [Patescibacteria group bacterium]